MPQSSIFDSDPDRRRFVAGCAALTGITVIGCVTRKTLRPPTVLFVCQYGTAKSAIAREVFRQRAARRGLAVVTFSRGVTIEDHISAALRVKLDADGINPNADRARLLEPVDWQAADILVRFNPLPNSVTNADIRDWSDLPSVNESYPEARVILNRRIDALLDEIDRQRKPR